jgi:hypothetical protein
MPGQLIKNVLMKFNSLVIRETNFLMDIFNFSEVDVTHHVASWQEILGTARTVPFEPQAQKTIMYFS